jgi:probable rRNA maturation factor
MRRRGHQINIQIKRGLKVPFSRRWLTAICRAVLDEEQVIQPVEIECIITDDTTIQKLNKQFRNIDEPTDVLSFAFKDTCTEAQVASFPSIPDSPEALGQIIVSFPRAVMQSAAHCYSIDQELAMLVVHGMLHLLGYDHHDPAEGREMKQREKHAINLLREKPGPA